MAEIKQTERAAKLLNQAYECCKEYRHEFIMPEHLLLMMIDEFNFNKALNIFYSPYLLQDRLKEFLEGVERMPEDKEYEPEASEQMSKVIEIALQSVVSSSADALDETHLVKGILQLEDSWACYLLKDSLNGNEPNFMSQLINFCDLDDQMDQEESKADGKATWQKLVTCMNDHYRQYNPLIGREQEFGIGLGTCTAD